MELTVWEALLLAGSIFYCIFIWSVVFIKLEGLDFMDLEIQGGIDW